MDTIFLTLLSLCLPASILIIIAILFRLVFKKAPKWLMGVMWAIVALRLIIPFQFESSIGLLPNTDNKIESFFTGNNETGYNESDSITYVIEDNGEVVSSEVITHEYTPNVVAPNEPDDVVHDYLPNETITVMPDNNDINGATTGRRELMIRLQMVWLFGMLIMLEYAVFSYVSLRKKTRTSIKLDSYKNVFECDEISTPFILGIFRPIIYIPSGLDANTIKNVLAHENAHIKRLDHIRKQLGFLILVMYWFNPLVWIAYILFCKDIELACDEKVISKMSFDEKKSYASSLLLCSAHKKLVLAYPLAFGEVAVKTRIKNILNYKTPALWVITIGIVLCIVIGFGFMTCQVNADQEEDIIIQNDITLNGEEQHENKRFDSDLLEYYPNLLDSDNVEVEYDENGYPVKAVDNAIGHQYEMTYENGRVSTITVHFEDGTSLKYSFIRNDDGQKTEVKRESDGTLADRTVIEYDGSGRRVAEHTYYADGEMVSAYIAYLYDEQGRRICYQKKDTETEEILNYEEYEYDDSIK